MFNQSEYIKSLEFVKDQPDDRPQVLMLGRSNVGKSSFINAITNRKKLARISNTPGKTLLMNFYLIDDSFYIVDAPGYGYAKRSKGMQQHFIDMIDQFLHESMSIKFVCLLIDFKVGPTKDDLEMYYYLQDLGLDILICATKLDKIPTTKRTKQEKLIKDQLHNPKNFIKVSSTDKINLDLARQYFIDRVGKDA
ncbi:MAG: ribosome biogenesis GTP-binding protein YihA/YsxC [Acholeplasmataceae bacterium]